MNEPNLMIADQAQPPAVIGQALLFSREIEVQVAAEEQRGVYTAARLFEKRRQVYDAIVQLLGADVGMLRIARLLGVHHLTVAAVRDREPEQIDIARSKTVAQLRTAVGLQVERLIAHPENVPWNVAGLLIAQLTDKAELLDGRATSRTEHREHVDIHGDWEQILKGLPTEKQADAREIGLVGEKDLAIEAAPGSMGGEQAAAGQAVPSSNAEPDLDTTPAVEADQGERGADVDAESVVSGSDCRENAEGEPALATDPSRSPAETADQDEAPDVRKGPGGGVGNCAAGAGAPILYEDLKFLDNRPEKSRAPGNTFDPPLV